MTKTSIWDSNTVKAIAAIAAIVTVLGFIIQVVGAFDFLGFVILPIINLFNIPVPLYSIPLAFLIVIAGFFGILYINEKLHPVSPSVSNPFSYADFLDDKSARLMALLCKTPLTTDTLKQKYQHIVNSTLDRSYNYDYCLKELEERGLIIFQNEKWMITQ
jgi:hypothetical protein